MYSEAHDDLYQFSFESRRWFPCALRKPRGAPASYAMQADDAPPSVEGGGQAIAEPERTQNGERGAAGRLASSVGEGVPAGAAVWLDVMQRALPALLLWAAVQHAVLAG